MINLYETRNRIQTMMIFITCSSVVIVGCIVLRLNFPVVKTLPTHLTDSVIKFRNDPHVKYMNVSVYKIGILIPSTTRYITKPSLNKLSLTNKCIPSILKFIEKKYNFLIYIGVDKGDYLETVKHKLETIFDKIKVVVTSGGSFTKTANAIAREAYTDGMDYLVRINDDTTFETNNWISQGIKVLQNFSPPNIGVVGPTCRQGNTAILTHDMVHRTHLEIFDFYYPPYFDNWWSDDWITRVYQPNRSTKLNTWVVNHHLSAHNTRYKVDFKQHSRLNKTLMFDTERLSEYLESHNRSQTTL